MLNRSLTHELQDQYQDNPLVWLSGPRGAGKTALVRRCFPEVAYYSLADSQQRLAAELNPEDFLVRLEEEIILDEVQRAPKLVHFVLIHLRAQTLSKKLLLVSCINPQFFMQHNPKLCSSVCHLTLWPLSYEEKPQMVADIGKLLLHGLSEQDQLAALATSLAHDVDIILPVQDIVYLHKLLIFLVERLGQTVNYSELARLLGVSSPTVKQWINVLKALYWLVEIPAFTQQVRTRAVKSPKLYFSDTSLVAALLAHKTPEQLTHSKLYPYIYENFMLMEVIKRYHHQGLYPQFWYFRDVQGHEVPLVVEHDKHLLPIAITPAEIFEEKTLLAGIRKFRRATNNALKYAVLLYNGETLSTFHHTRIFNLLAANQNPLHAS